MLVNKKQVDLQAIENLKRRCLFTVARPKRCRSAMLDPKDRAFCCDSSSLLDLHDLSYIQRVIQIRW